MQFQDARKGQIVRHRITGSAAKIIRPVKSRGVVTIEFTEGPRLGQWYDAFPQTLDALEVPA